MHALETVLPPFDFSLDDLPFLRSNLAHHVALDNDFFVELVNLSINDFRLNGLDSPFLHVVFVNLEQRKIVLV